MALLFIDGFDHYTGRVYTYDKWTGGSSNSIDTSIKRTGTASLKLWNDYLQCKKTFPSKDVVVVGCAIYKNFSNSSNRALLQFLNADTLQMGIRFNSNGVLGVYRNTTLLGSTDINHHFVNQWNYYEFKIKFHTTEGYIIIKRDEIEILSLTNINTSASATNYCDGFGFYGFGDYYIDDLYIDDANFNGDIKVVTIYPTGEGANTQWTPSAGNNYACVDEATINSDTDYIKTLTVDAIDTFVYGDLPSTGEEIKGVQINMTARMDDSGLNKIASVVRPTTTNIIGSTIDLTQLYVTHCQMYNINPETNQPWTIEDINNCEFGIKLIE